MAHLGPVDDEGVDVVQLEVGEGLHQVGLHVLRPVVTVPELGLDTICNLNVITAFKPPV